MPSFDISTKLDLQLLENAVNTTIKELKNRFDFKDSPFEIDNLKKENLLKITAESDMKLTQIEDVLISKCLKQHIDARSLDIASPEMIQSGKQVYKKIPVKNGLSQEDAKKVVKHIKDQQFKVQAAIMDDIIRVTSKKIDELQEVIQFLKQNTTIELPLQFINMKS